MKINILMSTYNGEKYIDRQVETILNQLGCDVLLTIRDDGSFDDTVKKIKNLQKKFPGHIQLHCGQNIGYRRSFCRLVQLSDLNSDYYGFADQDDVWDSDKCVKGVEKIYGQKIALYISSVRLTDEEGKQIGYQDLTLTPNTIMSYFSRHRLPGCGMIFTKDLRDIAVRFLEEDIENQQIDHDLVIGSLAYSYGKVIRDQQAFFDHIRHKNSVTSGGRGILNRIKMEKFILFQRIDVHYDLAKQIIKFNAEDLNDQVYIFLKCITEYKHSMKNKIDLLKFREFHCGIQLCDIETRIKILLGNF